MSDRAAQSSREAIQALRRIRAVESAPDADGIRTVWHQGARGTELVSYVTNEGRVVRQEFSLVGDHFHWTSNKGLTTGAISGAAGSKAGPASGMVVADPQILPERVLRAADAFASYDGDDKYVLHLKRTLELTARGLENTGEATVTRSISDADLSAARALAEQNSRPRSRLPLAMIAVAVVAVLALAAFVFSR